MRRAFGNNKTVNHSSIPLRHISCDVKQGYDAVCKIYII